MTGIDRLQTFKPLPFRGGPMVMLTAAHHPRAAGQYCLRYLAARNRAQIGR